MKLALIVTAHCNAACTHCSTSCGPRRSEQLPREKILGLMDEAARLSNGEPLKIGLTGGEPFLDFELLLQIAAHGRKLGAAEVSCVSNGYWATSMPKAIAMLSALKSAGLHKLAISSSRFHQQFVKIQRVERALAAAREVGLYSGLKFVRFQSDPQTAEEIRAWGHDHGADTVEVIDALPYLRQGASLPESEYQRQAGLPEGRCPVPLITVREDGQAFTCASPGAQVDFLALGSAHELGLEELRERFYLGGRQQILRQHGPIHFAQAIIAKGQGGRLRPAYNGVCDLCTHIVSDPVLAAIADETVQAFEARQIERMLQGLDASPALETSDD